MKRCQRADFARAGVKHVPASARLTDPVLDAEERLRGGAAETNQDIGIGELDLAQDERQADLTLLRRRRTVAGRTPRYDVGDISSAAIDPDRCHHPVEQFSRAANEWKA